MHLEAPKTRSLYSVSEISQAASRLIKTEPKKPFSIPHQASVDAQCYIIGIMGPRILALEGGGPPRQQSSGVAHALMAGRAWSRDTTEIPCRLP